MKKYVGKTLDDALAAAASDKGCNVEELTYTLLEEKQGLLGFGSKVEIEASCDQDIADFIREYLLTYFKGINM